VGCPTVRRSELTDDLVSRLEEAGDTVWAADRTIEIRELLREAAVRIEQLSADHDR